MYEKLDLQLVLIVVNNILKIPNEIRYSYTIRNCDDDLPVFEDNYMKTLFNILIWLVKILLSILTKRFLIYSEIKILNWRRS